MKEILPQDLGLFAGLFRGIGGGGGKRRVGALPTIGRGSTCGFEAHPGTPVPSAPYSPSFITTEGKHARDITGHDR